MLIRRNAIEDVGGYDESMRVAEDTDLHWRLVEAGVRIGVRDEPLIVRRVFGDNLSYENPDRRSLRSWTWPIARSIRKRLHADGG